MSYGSRNRASEDFATEVAKVLRLDKDSATQLAELIETFVTGTVLDKHESEYYHNARPER